MRPLGCNMSTTVGLSALHNPYVTFWCKINQCKAVFVYPESANPRELQETFPNFLIFPSAVGEAALEGESSSISFCTDKVFFGLCSYWWHLWSPFNSPIPQDSEVAGAVKTLQQRLVDFDNFFPSVSRWEGHGCSQELLLRKTAWNLALFFPHPLILQPFGVSSYGKKGEKNH